MPKPQRLRDSHSRSVAVAICMFNWKDMVSTGSDERREAAGGALTQPRPLAPAAQPNCSFIFRGEKSSPQVPLTSLSRLLQLEILIKGPPTPLSLDLQVSANFLEGWAAPRAREPCSARHPLATYSSIQAKGTSVPLPSPMWLQRLLPREPCHVHHSGQLICA